MSAPGSLGGKQLCLISGDQKLIGMGATMSARREAGQGEEGTGKMLGPGNRGAWIP